MRGRFVSACLMLILGASVLAAQDAAKAPNYADIYCSGMVTNEAVPGDTYMISGEQSGYFTTFSQGDYVYANKGGSQGVKVGDEFTVMRPVKDPGRVKWFSWQPALRRAMGMQWKDLGRVRVVVVQANVSIAEVIYACDYLQRGDTLRPYVERPAPPLRAGASGKFDRFAPASGRAQAMVVSAKDFRQATGMNDVIYVNLGSGQGVNVGDYFRIFRYQGTRHDTVYQARGIAYEAYGFGSTPPLYKHGFGVTRVRYKWDQLPREVLGEGIVLRVTPNAATVLVTYSLREIYLGDYVELE